MIIRYWMRQQSTHEGKAKEWEDFYSEKDLSFIHSVVLATLGGTATGGDHRVPAALETHHADPEGDTLEPSYSDILTTKKIRKCVSSRLLVRDTPHSLPLAHTPHRRRLAALTTPRFGGARRSCMAPADLLGRVTARAT
ncbi:hypothetical protein PPROV_000597200 [Pycnococcus provasolii]|uniref:Uncharacterized protein n=1 Tax=Pycnococcus provasolii TaxID=41880 RepID=A0A830HN75_9CHLO|nr:hypothetical protein PPROV_000597200 [Pycnococcus provasolii]